MRLPNAFYEAAVLVPTTMILSTIGVPFLMYGGIECGIQERKHPYIKGSLINPADSLNLYRDELLIESPAVRAITVSLAIPALLSCDAGTLLGRLAYDSRQMLRNFRKDRP